MPIPTTNKDKQFMELLFEKYEESMHKLHNLRHERYRAEVECMNLQEEIAFIQRKIAYYEALDADTNHT